MNKKRLKLLALGFVIFTIILTGLVWRGSFAQLGEAQYFPETGHWVSGEFLDMYHSVDNPTELFGYPITVMFEDPLSNRIVQYFERTRFELHPEETAELNVQRTELGYYLYEAGAPLPDADKFTRCQEFKDFEKNFRVCDAFLDFFNKNGKLAFFGYPISNAELRGDRIVQYFQLARLEWQPNQPPDQRVIVSKLGLLYFNKMGEDPRWQKPPLQDNAFQMITRIQTRVFPGVAVVNSKDEQVIYVVVHDQNYLPVENASVLCEILLPSGEVIKNSKPLLTDENGTVTYRFSFRSSVKGEAVVTVNSRFSNLEKTARTSFRVWW